MGVVRSGLSQLIKYKIIYFRTVMRLLVGFKIVTFSKIRYLLGFLIFILIFTFVDVLTVIDLLWSASPCYVSLGVIFIITSIFLAGANLYLFFCPRLNMRFFDFMKKYWFSWAVGLLMPGQVGEVASLTCILCRSKNIDIKSCSSILLIDKLITLMVMIFFALATTIQLKQFEARGIVYIIFFIFSTLIFIFLLCYFFKKSRLVTVFFFNKIFFYLKVHPKLILQNIFLTFVKVVLVGFSYYFMLLSIGKVDVSVVIIISLVMTSSLIAYFPLSINGLGSVELTSITLFSYVGISSSHILAMYALTRLTVYLTASVPLFFCKDEYAKSH